MKQHLKAPDPWAAITGALLAISGVFELEKRLGITASDMAIFIGSVVTIAASWRHVRIVRNGTAAALPPSAVETLTGDSDASDEPPA